MEKIVIIGGVAAGMTFAAKLNREQPKIEHVLYEKRSYTSLGACGIPFVVGDHAPNGSKDLLDPTYEEQITKGINIQIEHEVVKVDLEKKELVVKNLTSNKTFTDTYTKLFIATGARPRTMEVKGKELDNIHYATTFEQAQSWVKLMHDKSIQDIVIVGSGFIGLEMAESFKLQGKNITIIEALARPASNIFDSQLTNEIETLFDKHNITFKKNEMVQSFGGNKKVQTVITNKGEYKADAVLISIGYIPNTSLFQDQLKTLANGAIVVNRKGETSVKDVYAAGDCIAVFNPILNEQVYVPLATTSRRMATIVFENMIKNKNQEYIGSIGSSGFRLFDKEFFATGITETRAQNKNINHQVAYVKGTDAAFYSGRAQELHLKLIADDQGIIIGAQCYGASKSAALRIAMLAAAITKKMTTAELEHMDLFYTPPYSKATDLTAVAARILNKKLNR